MTELEKDQIALETMTRLRDSLFEQIELAKAMGKHKEAEAMQAQADNYDNQIDNLVAKITQALNK